MKRAWIAFVAVEAIGLIVMFSLAGAHDPSLLVGLGLLLPGSLLAVLFNAQVGSWAAGALYFLAVFANAGLFNLLLRKAARKSK